jgi:thioredoxin reductase (NADPH)
VVEVESYSGCRSVTCEDGKAYTSCVVVLAGGVRPKKLGVPGEDRFQGKGVIHCAFCDAGLYADRVVAVCGGGDAGLIEASFLAKHASKVYVIEAQERLTGTPALQERARANPKLEVRCGQKVVEIAGDQGVTAVQVEDSATGRSERLEVYGVLAHVGFEPTTDCIAALVRLDERGYIAVNADMETGEPGVFAAGDIRSGSPRAVATAIEDGTKAAASAQRFLESLA